MNQAEQRTRAKEIFTVTDGNGEKREDVLVLTELQLEKSRKAKEIQLFKKTSNSPFVFVEMEGADKLTALLSNNKKLGYFLILQTYVDYKNMLRHNGDKLPMKNVEIRKTLAISNRATFNTIMNEFKELGLIYKKDVALYGKTYEAIFINQDYCFRKGITGEFKNRKTQSAVKVFLDSLQTVYSQQKVNAGDIGLIYKATQFLHLDSNILVAKPMEQELLFADALSLEAFAKTAGMTVDALYKKVRSLTYPCIYNGMEIDLNVFSRIKVGTKTVLKLNPFVAWRKAGEPSTEVFAEFVLEHNSRAK